MALHSDFTLAQALPLTNAWVAANRINSEGSVMSPEERLTLDQELRAITINAAYILNKENQMGSLRNRKLADLTVLEQDPYEVGVENLKDIPVWGTIFEGEAPPVKKYAGFRKKNRTSTEVLTKLGGDHMPDITIFQSKKIITMNLRSGLTPSVPPLTVGGGSDGVLDGTSERLRHRDRSSATPS